LLLEEGSTACVLGGVSVLGRAMRVCARRQVLELQQKLSDAEERARQLQAAQGQLKERLAQAEQALGVRTSAQGRQTPCRAQSHSVG